MAPPISLTNKKYVFSGQSKIFTDHNSGKTYEVWQIMDSQGALGGWIESEPNLSPRGLCWVSDKSIICGNSVILDSATVRGNSILVDSSVLDDSDIDSSHLYDTDIRGKSIIMGCSLFSLALKDHQITGGVYTAANPPQGPGITNAQGSSGGNNIITPSHWPNTGPPTLPPNASQLTLGQIMGQILNKMQITPKSETSVSVGNGSKYPHICPRCKSWAYIGFNSIDCTNKECS
jgi:hypothetical protein